MSGGVLSGGRLKRRAGCLDWTGLNSMRYGVVEVEWTGLARSAWAAIELDAKWTGFDWIRIKETNLPVT